MKINDVLLARILQSSYPTKNHKIQLQIDLISSFSSYFTINGNSNSFKCRDCVEFQYDTFENATRICKNQGGFDDLFPNFPDLNNEIRHLTTWGPFDWELNTKLKNFVIGREHKQPGYHKNYTSGELREIGQNFLNSILRNMDRLQTDKFKSFWSREPFHRTWRFRSGFRCIQICNGFL